MSYFDGPTIFTSENLEKNSKFSPNEDDAVFENEFFSKIKKNHSR